MGKPANLIENEHFMWDGDDTFVALTKEVHTALEKMMQTQTWPFIKSLASWDQKSPDSGVIHFSTESGLDPSDVVAVVARNIA